MNRHYFEYIERKAESNSALQFRAGAMANIKKIKDLTGCSETHLKAHILQLADREEAKPIDFYFSYYNATVFVRENIINEMTEEN